jgi:hypothetical protein
VRRRFARRELWRLPLRNSYSQGTRRRYIHSVGYPEHGNQLAALLRTRVDLARTRPRSGSLQNKASESSGL